MEVLNAPYTIEEIKEKKDSMNYISGIVSVSFFDTVKMDEDGFLDTISEKLVEKSTLREILFEVVGHKENDIFIKVTGNVSDILEEYDEFEIIGE